MRRGLRPVDPFRQVSSRERLNADRFLADLLGRGAPRGGGRIGPLGYGPEDASEAAGGLPTLRQVWDRNKLSLVFHFKPIETTFTDSSGTFKGRFWVNADAIKWKIPASETALLAQWNRYKTADPIDTDGDMLCRLPCSAKECQALADVLETHPDPSTPGAEDGLINRRAPLRTGMAAERSLLLTPYLYSRRYQQMTCKVEPVGRDTNATIVVTESAKHNQYVNQRIQACMQAAGDSYRVPSVGDPGKIWAITNGVYATKAANGRPSAINYGWHSTAATTKSMSVIPGLKLIQSIGTRHDDDHSDYSQIAVLVSGWCEITEPGQSQPSWMRTEDVYKSSRLYKLVSHEDRPLTRVRYDV